MTSRRGHPVLSAVLGVLACLLVVAATVGSWVHDTVLDTDSWVAVVGPLAGDPAVQQAASEELTRQLLAVVDSQDLVRRALPDQADVLAPQIQAAAERYVRDTVDRVVRSPQFEDLWIEANRNVHAATVKVLRGQSNLVQTSDGQVAANLLPLMGRVVRTLQAQLPGFLGGREFPDVSYDLPPEVARGEMSAALGRPLPSTFGVVPLFRSESLTRAQQGVEVADVAVALTVAVSVVLGILSVVSARRRWRALGRLAVGAALAVGVSLAAVLAGRDLALEAVSDRIDRNAAAAVVARAITPLYRLGAVVIVVAALLAAAGFVLDRLRPAGG